MSQRDYDIVVVGGTVSARMSATLLAKSGLRVLQFTLDQPNETGWFFSSIFLEKLLGTLGGRSCFADPVPFQVISPDSRITIHPETSLANELTREFGKTAYAVINLLDEFLKTGQTLNNLLWENGGLPWPGLKHRGRFRYLCLRHKISPSDLGKPFEEIIRPLEKAPKTFLKNLFQGLSLRPANTLTYADAALLWVQANRPESLAVAEFNELLDKRFDQFHGIKLPLEDLERLDVQHNLFTGGALRDRGTFTTKHLLIGDRAGAAAQLKQITLEKQAWQTRRITTSDLTGQLSPLLAERVIIGAAAPTRLAFQKTADARIGVIDHNTTITSAQLRQIMEPILPFADYDLCEAGKSLQEAEASEPPGLPSPPFPCPLQLDKNLFCADSAMLYPGMPAAGGALISWSLLSRLGKTDRSGKADKTREKPLQ